MTCMSSLSRALGISLRMDEASSGVFFFGVGALGAGVCLRLSFYTPDPRNVPYLIHVSPILIPYPSPSDPPETDLMSSMSPTSANVCDCECVHERVHNLRACRERQCCDLSTPDRGLYLSLLKWARSQVSWRVWCECLQKNVSFPKRRLSWPRTEKQPPRLQPYSLPSKANLLDILAEMRTPVCAFIIVKQSGLAGSLRPHTLAA